MATASIAAAWYRGLLSLAAQGVDLPGPDNSVLESAWKEFSCLASMVVTLKTFRKEGPKLAASLAEEALARHARGLDEEI
ncbi:MAG: hypothetical protein JSU73_11525 [candidate division WOR-3 bacterium]|nr:MAG: hypothetical protein JSU73_11525 [candidate division WOR-3 bacterium]